MGLEEVNPIKVDIHQFYGIEINDFAVSVATTALWIAESQMMKETSEIISFDLDMLPLKTYRNIKEGNALKLPWTEWEKAEDRSIIVAGRTNLYIRPEIPASRVGEAVAHYGEIDLYSEEVSINPSREKETYIVYFHYIMGNPPFVGARLMTESQKQDMSELFGAKWKNLGNMDYVSGWYYKAAKVMTASLKTRTALVSTNSITQGEQVANLWKPLVENMGMHIDFACRTFRWDSESSLKARVHCVVIGFSMDGGEREKLIFTESSEPLHVRHINPYLVDGQNVWIESRNSPLCDVPEIGIGNKPIDGGNYLFTEDEMRVFIQKEPAAAKYFRKWVGADEFINRWFRYCLWLGDCQPNELRAMPECMKQVRAVRDFRLASKSEGTRKLADRPTRFHVENMPGGNYLLIPRVSSEKRRYVPIGYMDSDVFCSDSVHITQHAGLYHFGVLTSNVHMAWMRVVCGRLKSDYRYSKDIVYNNFPWPSPTDAQKAKIERTAQAVLNARAEYPESSLADLYDEVTMPAGLRQAHQDNDRAVMQAYGFSSGMTESGCVAALFERYGMLSQKK